jgi:SAM-dependent methyltransferase
MKDVDDCEKINSDYIKFINNLIYLFIFLYILYGLTNIDIINVIKLLLIKRTDKHKWVKYYEFETYKYYDYLINIIPINQRILEIGSGGGIFYIKNRDILIKRNNEYTCIDIDDASIEYSRMNCDYVNFLKRDICDFTEMELKQFDLLLLVQSYIVIPTIKKIFKKYFKVRPNGYIMMVNTIFPYMISGIITSVKPYFSKINDCKHSKALTLNDIEQLGLCLKRKITNIKICKSSLGFDEWLTIIR